MNAARFKTLSRHALGGLALGLSVLLSACATPTLYIGEPIRSDGLKKLVSQESTEADVLEALGRPRGTGMMRHSPDQPLRRIWYYEYIRIKGEQVESSALLVYLDGNRYDGHLLGGAQELLKMWGP